MKLIIALLTLLFCLAANAKDITLEYLKNQPKGISRDFYIWLFLQQNITPKEATQAYKLTSRENAKIFSLYYKKGDNKTLSRKTICQQMPLPKLLKQDTQCIAFGLTLKESQTLDKKTLLNLSKKLEKQDKMLSTHLRILASKDPFLNLIKTDSKTFASFYFNVSQELKQKLNAPIPKATLIQYISQNNIAFMRFLRQTIINPNMQHLNYSLTQISPKEILQFLDDESAFYLGINAIKYNNAQDSLQYFLHSSQVAKYTFEKNRGIFWAYLASKDINYLHKLSQSKSADIYTLASLEITNNTPQFEILYDIKTPTTLAKWNTKNPFEWEIIKDSYQKNPSQPILQKVYHSDTKPHFVWLNKQKDKEYFLKPFAEILSPYSNDTKALLYALGRQESLFIPTAISTSYALGVMQLMPFNVTALAKKFKEENKISYLDMFDPAINIPYAEYFTRPLIKEFKHPLFVSYAYNGGPGFTRRLLAKNQLFKKSNPLDPWYSMEMIPYEETRKYGKKVLANYIIYQKSFGKDIKLLNSLQQTLLY